jgi:hypothetical protein
MNCTRFRRGRIYAEGVPGFGWNGNPAGGSVVDCFFAFEVENETPVSARLVMDCFYMIQKQGSFGVPLYDVKVLVLVPMPVPGRDEIILVNRYILELGWVVGRLNLKDAAPLRWLCPASRSPTVPLLEGFTVGSDGSLELRSHLGLRRDKKCNTTDRKRWRGNTEKTRILNLIRRGDQRKENAQEAVFKCEKHDPLICVTDYFQFVPD